MGMGDNHTNGRRSSFQDYSNSASFAQQEQPQQQQQINSTIPNNGFLQTHAGVSPVGSGAGSNHVSPGAGAGLDTTDFPPFDFNVNNTLDPGLLSDFDPSSLELLPNSGMQMHNMTTAMAPQNNNGTHPMDQYRPRDISESLNPASAMWPNNEWATMFKGHHRSPSDNISEYSSHSNQASPFVGNLDSFDPGHASPLLNPSPDPSMHNDLGLQAFTISDAHSQGLSPGHSPHMSPQQQSLPPFHVADNYGLPSNLGGQFMQNDIELFSHPGQEAFPAMGSQIDLGGAADMMSPPEINIDYAPESRPLAEVSRPLKMEDSLSPPLRTQSRNRMRAKSDSYAGGRPPTPGIHARGRSPSLQPNGPDTLSPFDHSSRSPSPVRGRNESMGNRARSASHASDRRDYILDLANPERTPSNGAESRRVQKHPATFQCTLCPKKFTRAYNLRSHLRTHTDERPFVCTVCGKAFARQHDRKRHEGLHSGEKKFVCRGTLQSNSAWGCGRKFARADALGRHFRSEAGRVCIKPLLDEEAAERQKAWMEEQQQAQLAAGLMASQPMMSQPQVDMIGTFLPAALLQQYPALAGIDWNALPQSAAADEDYGGRSSFDAGASSGGEFFDDMSENEMGGYSTQMNDNTGLNVGFKVESGQQHGTGAYGDASNAGYMR